MATESVGLGLGGVVSAGVVKLIVLLFADRLLRLTARTYSMVALGRS